MQLHVFDVPKTDIVSTWPGRMAKQRLSPQEIRIGDYIKRSMTRGPNTNLRVIDKQWIPGSLCYRLWTVRQPSLRMSIETHKILNEMYQGIRDFDHFEMRVYGHVAKLVRFEDAQPTGQGHCAFCGSYIDKDEPAMKLVFADHQRPGFNFNKTKMGGEWICQQTVHAHPDQCGVGSKLVNYCLDNL